MHAPNPRKKPRRGAPAARIARAVLLWGLAIALLAVAVLVTAVAMTTSSLPAYRELQRIPQGQSVVIRAADGTELVTVGPSFGRWLAYEDIPPEMIAAMKAVEDRRFDWHPGVDPVGTARAIKVRVETGRWSQGGSTITQQLARNIFLTNVRTFDRKLREAVLALALERKLTKEQILELYLNRVYFGGGAYGIDAASRKFFGHPATELSLEEAAIIAGLVKAPSRYAPTADPERARSRAATVVATMADAGAISPEQAAGIRLGDVRFAVDRTKGDVRYFTDWVLTQLDTLTDEAVQPLEVVTTLIPDHQRAAEAAAATQGPAGTQIGIVAMTTDGRVTAMVGGRDYATSVYNRAVTARRQPGSAFKLFTWLAALEDGMTPDDMVVDEPVRLGNWSPRNDNRRFTGPVTLRQAFARSINTVAAKLGARVGFDTVAGMARRLGITTPINRQPAMVLGTSDVTLLELTSAYAAIANNGVEVRPWGIAEVRTASGELLYAREPETPRVLVAPFVAAWMTDMLQAVVEQGTGRAAQIGRPVAGKTGTTSSNRDGWFIGFTPELVAGVWLGRDDARAVPGLAGGRAPAAAFAAFMSRALANTPVSQLASTVETPDGFLEPDAEVYGIDPSGSWMAPAADEVPIPEPLPDPLPRTTVVPPVARSAPAQPAAPLTDQWLDQVLRDDQPAAPPR
jgi:penicillin-binding protein 1A